MSFSYPSAMGAKYARLTDAEKMIWNAAYAAAFVQEQENPRHDGRAKRAARARHRAWIAVDDLLIQERDELYPRA